jgi:hypothetical protein
MEYLNIYERKCTMQYTLDFEFDGYLGKLISMALVREDLVSMYVGFKDTAKGISDLWVTKNVIPILNSGPFPIRWRTNTEVQEDLEKFFAGDNNIEIITDWPDDVAYFSKLLLTGPGTMINIPGIRFDVRRIDAYPSRLKGAIQHNALWDAMALMYKVTHPNPPSEYMIVKVLNGRRYYYAEEGEGQVFNGSLGTWTRKRKSAKVVTYEHAQKAADVISKWTGDINESSTGQRNEVYSLSYHNQAHIYYGRSLYAVKKIAWLFGIGKNSKHILSKRKGDVKLQVVEIDTNKEMGNVNLSIDLTGERAFVKKRRKDEAPHIDDTLIKFDPTSGGDISSSGFTGGHLRRSWSDMTWTYNPWTGKKRTDEEIASDPIGLNIQYGDNE